MDCLIVYESAYGNTATVAWAMARALERALGTSSQVRVDRVEELAAGAFDRLDLLVIGAPTRRHRAPSDLRERLDEIPARGLEGVPALVFDTRYHRAQLLTGSAARGMARQLEARGARLLAPAESFFVVGRAGPLEPGELDRAAAWVGSALGELLVPSPS